MMQGIGVWEILIIIAIAVIFIRPEDLPKIARKLGKWYRKFKEITSGMTNEIRDIEKEVMKSTEDSIGKPLNDTAAKVTEGFKKHLESVRVDPARISFKPYVDTIKKENDEEDEFNYKMEYQKTEEYAYSKKNGELKNIVINNEKNENEGEKE